MRKDKDPVTRFLGRVLAIVIVLLIMAGVFYLFGRILYATIELWSMLFGSL